MNSALCAFAILIFLLIGGCALQTPNQSPALQPIAPTTSLTPGRVEEKLIKGKTLKAEVASALGSPNIVTRNASGKTIWIYEQSRTTVTGNTQRLSGGGMGGAIFGSGAGLLWGGASNTTQSAERTSRKATLLITFRGDVIEDYELVYTSF
jgi:hypothetical protein